jgi:hypothetical protein
MVTFSLSAQCGPQVPPFWPCHCRRGLYQDEWKGDDAAAISGEVQSEATKDLLTMAVSEQSFKTWHLPHMSQTRYKCEALLHLI